MIDTFSRQQFESALPEGHWTYTGLVNNEHTYSIQITPDIFITIRSSVDGSGWSADTGDDSIRAWLVDKDGSPLGSKISKYTTRLPGWESRLLGVLRGLWHMAELSGYCPKCHQVRGVFKTKKAGPNKNRLFAKCKQCDTFEWLGGGRMTKIKFTKGMIIRAQDLGTGYFADTKHGTKVHLVDGNNRPICGSKIGTEMEYQWCSRRPHLGYVECGRCKQIYLKEEEKAIQALKK